MQRRETMAPARHANLTRRVLGAAVALALLVVSVGRAQTEEQSVLFAQANEYFEIHRIRNVAVHVNLQDLRTQPARFSNRLVEMIGDVFALGGADGEPLIFLRPNREDRLYEIHLPEGDEHSDWPFLVEENTVRLLCRVGAVAANGDPKLRLVTAVEDLEAQFMDRFLEIRKLDGGAEQPRPPGAPPPPQNPAAFNQRFAAQSALDAYVRAIQYFRPGVDVGFARRVAQWIVEYSRQHNVDPRLVIAIVAKESGFNPRARSPVGARGLGQLMPGTAADLGVRDSFDPEQNLRGSIQFLARNLKGQQRPGRSHLEVIQRALACYNAGPGNVAKWAKVPPIPFRDTRGYVATITAWYRQMLPDADRARLASF